MKTFVTLSLHENYVTVAVRFCQEIPSNYNEYSFHGVEVVKLLKEPYTVKQLRTRLETYDTYENPDPRLKSLRGFEGHFSIKYEVINDENITEFDVIESRFINKTRGGRSVSGGFKDKMFGKRIFNNLMNAVADKDVNKLNGVMSALAQIGG